MGACFSTSLPEAASRGNFKAVRKRVESGGDINQKWGGGGFTALICASANGHKKIAQYLVDKGASLDIQDYWGNTALIWASARGKKEIAQYLVDKGASLDIKGEYGDTALIFASKKDHKEIAQYLVDKGASLDIKGKDGKTALDVAISNEIVQYLEPRVALINITKMVATKDTTGIARELEKVDTSFDVNRKYQDIEQGEMVFKWPPVTDA